MPRPRLTPVPTRSPRRTGAFTLVEILIVVVILGVLASIALPKFADATTDSKKSVFASDLAYYNRAAQMYISQTGELLEDSASGAVPSGFEDYINVSGWTDGTPVGGVWDAEANSYGVECAIGVHFQTAAEDIGDAFMLGVDEMIDDGNLTTGIFRKFDTGRYYLVVAQ